MERLKLEDIKALNPEFINMVVRELSGDVPVGDAILTGWGSSKVSLEAAKAALLNGKSSINELQSVNGGFIAAMVNSSHIQNIGRNMLTIVGQAGNNDTRLVLMINFIVQSMLLGIRLGEHLHDKRKRGLIR